LFFAVVRFSPPSPKAEAVKRKAEAKNNSPDLQEPTFNLLVAAKGEARGRAGFLLAHFRARLAPVPNRGIKPSRIYLHGEGRKCTK